MMKLPALGLWPSSAPLLLGSCGCGSRKTREMIAAATRCKKVTHHCSMKYKRQYRGKERLLIVYRRGSTAQKNGDALLKMRTLSFGDGLPTLKTKCERTPNFVHGLHTWKTKCAGLEQMKRVEAG